MNVSCFLFWLRKQFPKRADCWQIVLKTINAINSRSAYCLNSQNSIVNVHQSKPSQFANRNNANILEDEWLSEYTVSTSLVITVFNVLTFDKNILIHYTGHSGSVQYICSVYIHINCLMFSKYQLLCPQVPIRYFFLNVVVH